MFNLDFDYLFLNFLLLFVFALCGSLVSKGYSFWKCALACIVVFAFVQGTRYARGNDYLDYSHAFLVESGNQSNPAFISFYRFLKFFGINQYSCFMVYAAFYISGGMFFLRYFRKYAAFLFPLFIIGYMNFEEYMIRQAFSYSFFFLFLVFFFKSSPTSFNKIINHKFDLLLCVILAVITLLFHTGNALNIIAYIGAFYLLRKPITPLISLPALLFCTYVLPKLFDFTLLNSALEIVSESNDMAASYNERSDYWFSKEGMQSQYTRAPFIGLLETVGLISYFVLGHYIITTVKKDKTHLFTTFFNVSVLGFCIVALFRELEILHRIGQVMSLGWCVVASYLLYFRKRVPKVLALKINEERERFENSRNKKLCIRIKSRVRIYRQQIKQYNHSYAFIQMLYFCLLWFFYDYLKYLFFPGNMTLFIWDTDFPFWGS